MSCDWNKCNKEARWEVGFTMIINDIFMFGGSGKNEYQQLFCDEHFITLNRCGNVVEFRHIRDEKWKDFDDYDNPFVLRDIVKNSYKVYISQDLKFNKSFF